METRKMLKELGLLYVVFLTVPLYLQWDQFIIAKVTIPIKLHQVPSKVYVGFQKVKSEPIDYCNFVVPQGCSWGSLHYTKNYLDYLQIEIFKVNPHRDSNIAVPIVCALSKKKSHLINQHFVHVSITILKLM